MVEENASRPPLRPYLIALALTLATALLRALLTPVLGDEAPLILFTLPILGAARLGGLGPGLLATATSAVLASWLFLQPRGELLVAFSADQSRLLLLVAVGAAISVMLDEMRRTRASLERTRIEGALQQAALSRSEDRLRQLFETAGVGLWIEDFAAVHRELEALRAAGVYDLEAHLLRRPEEVQRLFALVQVVDANRTAVELVGAGDRDQLLGSLEQVFLPRTLEVFRAELVALWEQRPFHGEAPLRTLAGEELTVAVAIHFPPLGGDYGHVPVSVVDLTARKRVEQALAERERKLRLALDVGRLGDWEMDLATQRAQRSLRHDQIFGYGAGLTDWTYQLFLEHVVPEDRERVHESFRRAVAEMDEWDVECRVRRSDGELRWIWSRGGPVLDQEGRVTRMVGLVQDTTERKRSEELLRESEARLRAALSSSPMSVCRMDTALRYTWVGNLPEGFDDAEVIGRSDEEFLGAQVAGPLMELKRGVLATGIGVRREMALELPRGQRVFDFTIEPIHTPEGRIDGLMVAAVDITASRTAERERELLLESERAARAEAERASRVKDEFLATLSHELRTPLNAILGWSQLLRRGALKGDEIGRAAEVIERNVQAQSSLINDLLDMSRITSGKMRLDVAGLHFKSVVDAAIESVQHAADAKGLALEVHAEAGLPPVRGDAARLQQVVWNLLSNAIKFTDSGGRIQVRLRRSGERLLLDVQDSGRGIPPEFLERLFQRFHQADPSTTRMQGGLGLGLSISRHLVELHGGTIDAASDGHGKGATFSVSLPCAAAAAVDERRAEPGLLVAASLASLCVVVVEDDPDSLAYVARVLGDAGAQVISAASAREALAALDGASADVLVSDIGMPGEDGYALIRKVRGRGDARGGSVPAVALTAYARTEDRTRALTSGFQAHLSKPVDAAELCATVATLASMRRRRGGLRSSEGATP